MLGKRSALVEALLETLEQLRPAKYPQSLETQSFDASRVCPVTSKMLSQ